MASKPEVELTSEARQKRARELFDRAASGERGAWRELWQFNKVCKKNWKALGFSTREIDRIKLNKPDWI